MQEYARYASGYNACRRDCFCKLAVPVGDEENYYCPVMVSGDSSRESIATNFKGYDAVNTWRRRLHLNIASLFAQLWLSLTMWYTFCAMFDQ